MVFSGVTFIVYFLPIVLAVYALAPRRAKNLVLSLASLIFYIWGSGALVAILFVSIVVDYVLGFLADRAVAEDRADLRRAAVTLSVVVNLSMLAWFKYAGWLIGAAADAGVWTGAVPDVTLPIGISFFTFQSMSYTIDVARGRCRHLRNPLDFMLYVSLFPQLIAGPIVRYHEIEAQIRERSQTLDQFGAGVVRFSHGLAKKVIVADTIAPIADAAFAADDPSFLVAWVGAIAYTLQIYFDFSGYSDMAIGLGLMFGFTFPENFARPYSSVSITDFWRRWHMTLSHWFRDYVYVPLGGSRGSSFSTYRNLMAVFVLTGVWHGANWTFLLWGLYHGGWLMAERRFGWRATGEVARPALRRAATLLIVVVGWVLFRAASVGAAWDMYGAMFTFDIGNLEAIRPLLSTRVVITMLVASAIAFLLPRTFVSGPTLVQSGSGLARAGRSAVMVVGLPISVLLLAAGSFSPFLYFRF